MGRVVTAIAVACSALLSACASATPEAIAANDPFEPMNRAVYRFDKHFDKYVVLPVAGIYIYWLPQPVRRGVHNVLSNLNMPVTFANDLFQGQFLKAGESLGRLTLNTTIGVGGLVDVATPAGLPYQPADFGQTLGRYGVGEGPFLVLPFFGPEPPRDLVGDIVDVGLHPFFYVPPSLGLAERASISLGVQIGSPYEVHARNIVLRNELERGSIDPYVTMRSIYRQQRDELINNGVPSEDVK